MRKYIVFFIFILLLVYFNKSFTTKSNIYFSDEMTDIYIKSLEDEISKYKDISNIKDCINASIIYRHPIYWYDKVTINKGKKDNIKEKEMVVNKDGVVGIIEKVSNNTSIVKLITGMDNITVKIDNSYGILSTYDKIKNELVVSEITKDIDNSKDVNVLTTGFTNTFKEGIIIGKVKRIESDENGISKNAFIEPIVDYNSLKYVCVIK